MKTLSLFVAIMSFVLVGTALADGKSSAPGQTIKITSFAIVAGNNNNVADLCGRVTPPPTSPTPIQVVVDQGFKTEAHYNTLVGSDGQFCMMVTTYYGRAEASVLK